MNKTQSKKLDTAIRVEKVRLEKLHEIKVNAEVERRVSTIKESCRAIEDEAREREAQCSAAMASVDCYLTEEEFKFILNCLHPDRAPADRKERFSKAFGIFKRLETYVNHKLPLSVLRERGWAS